MHLELHVLMKGRRKRIYLSKEMISVRLLPPSLATSIHDKGKRDLETYGSCDADFLQIIRGEVGKLLVSQVIDCSEILRFML